jgi:predicted nucleic acid-binding protein
MKIYLDTSTLFKLYHQEIGTEEIDDFFATNAIKKIYISEIAKIEFISTVWKKIRMSEILEADGLEIIALFKEDLKNTMLFQLMFPFLN